MDVFLFFISLSNKTITMTAEEIITKLNSTDLDRSKVKSWLNSMPKGEHKASIHKNIQATNGAWTKELLISWLTIKESIEDKEVALNEVKEVITPTVKEVKEVQTKKRRKGHPTTYKKGDVLMHDIFRHPYVLLEYKKESNTWLCGLLTSESKCNEILEPCKSRFADVNFFTKVLFTVTDDNMCGSYMFPYDNTRHLTAVLKKLKQIFA